MKHLLRPAFLAALLALPALGQELPAEVTRVLDMHRKIRPGEEELAVYRLDWVDTLEEAQRRAAAEGRPVCLVANRAPWADLKNNHC